MSNSNKSWWTALKSIFVAEKKDVRTQLTDLLEASKVQNTIDSDALSMVEGVLTMTENRVRDVMVSRGQMVCIEPEQSIEEVLELILQTSHSRYPVLAVENEEGHVILGILIVKDILKAVVQHKFNTKEDLIALYRPPMVVPESKRLNVLLREFKSSRSHMAVVVDEYGELAGLITIEDVLEEIVGEIVDEHDEEETDMIFKHLHGGYTVDAMTPLEDFNAFFKVNIEDDMVETIGGAINKFLGHIPHKGEKIEMAGWLFEVTKADERKIECLRVVALPKEEEDG